MEIYIHEPAPPFPQENHQCNPMSYNTQTATYIALPMKLQKFYTSKLREIGIGRENTSRDGCTCPRRSISDFLSFFIAYTLPVVFSLQTLTCHIKF